MAATLGYAAQLVGAAARHLGLPATGLDAAAQSRGKIRVVRQHGAAAGPRFQLDDVAAPRRLGPRLVPALAAASNGG